MYHFFATFSVNSLGIVQSKRVNKYFQNLFQKEVFSFDNKEFHTKIWSHKSWGSPNHISFQRGHLTFIGSARLDNLDELMSDLANEEVQEASEIILALFEKYQEKCLERLSGDFGFLIYDAEKNQVWCVKDQLGVCPLFYLQNEDFTLFSSSLAAIRAYVGLEYLSINKKYVAKELKNYPVDVEETFFNEIHRLKPAHYAKIGLGNSPIQETRYWTFKLMDTTAFSNEKLVFDELRRLFNQAIAIRLRDIKIAATQLSGGLDSSAITVLASRILPKENLHTFSFVLNEKTRPYSELGIDEQVTQNSIRAYANLIHENHHYSDGFYYQNTFECYDKSNEIMGGYADSDCIWQDSMYKQAAEFGVELMFSGFPGDEGISNTGSRYFFEYFNKRKWSWLISQAIKYPYGFTKKCYHYFFGMYSNSILKGYSKIQKNRNLLDSNSEFNSLLKDSSFQFTSSFRQELIETVYRAHSCLRIESESLYASQYGIVTVYPMADLRFVQFALSLPIEYFNPQKYSRALFRTICEGILPDDVRLQKKRNGAMTLAFTEFWEKEQIRDFADWEIKNSLDLIDTHKVFDDSKLQDIVRKVVRNKMDYLIEKNLVKNEK